MKWLKKLVDDDLTVVACLLCFFIAEVVALVTKIFNGDVSVFAGYGFVASAVAMVAIWISTYKKSETAGFGATIGVLLGTVFTYLLGV